MLAQAWDEVQAITLRRSWQKILPLPKEDSNDSLLNLFELASDFGEDPVAEELSSSTSTGGSRGYAY